MSFVFNRSNDANIVDISDEQYLDLINYCFNNSSYFALTFLHIRQGVDQLESLNKYLYTEFKTNDELWYPYGQEATVKIYNCTEESKKILLTQTNSLFSWEGYEHHNAEDLAFFREDGTAAFNLVTHEGTAFVYNRSNEDVPTFIHNKPWDINVDIKGYYPVIWTAKYIIKLNITNRQMKELDTIRRINIDRNRNKYRLINK